MAFLSNISIVPTDPLALVVSVQEAKDYLVADFDDRDTEIEGFIRSATKVLQSFTGKAFLPSTISLYAEMVCGDSFILPYSNGAIDDNIKGNKYYTTESGDIIYTCGATEDWMKTAVLKYVADLFDNKGEGRTDVGIEAKSYASQFISHGGFF